MSELFDDKNRLKVSASQILSFKNCKRFWYINKVQGKATKETPALIYGKKFHSCIEMTYDLLTEGYDLKDVRKKIRRKYFPEITDMVLKGWRKGILTLPPKKLIEKYIKIPIGDYGLLRGYIDFYNVSEGKIEDHKTIGNWHYALTQKDLKENLQLMIYAYWAFKKLPKKDKITVRHNQFYKENGDESKFIEEVVTRDHVIEYWKENVEKTVQEMVEYARIQSINDVEGNLNHCGAYGGCCFKEKDCPPW
jgi:hypothetical protein